LVAQESSVRFFTGDDFFVALFDSTLIGISFKPPFVGETGDLYLQHCPFGNFDGLAFPTWDRLASNKIKYWDTFGLGCQWVCVRYCIGTGCDDFLKLWI
jgi:hypothetical protein